MGLLSTIRKLLDTIKFEHTIFALPFAYIGAFSAAEEKIPWSKFGWILLAMVGARTAAMTFNRLCDLKFDRLNPRTKNWPLSSGEVTTFSAWTLLVIASGLFIFAAGMLNSLTLKLSPIALFIVLGYSYTKRFTALSHLFLGLALAIAPVGGWLAIDPTFSAPPFIIAAAVLLWVSGFDIIYSCQDTEFDRKTGLHSIPSKLGIAPALWTSRLLHVGMIALLVYLTHWLPFLGTVWFIGLALTALLLFYEHSIVKTDDLSRVNAAFFTANGLVSVLLLVAVIIDWSIEQSLI